ncbi:hypothetical protein [Desulfotruncus arcticus]|uniref:hypothetical protein n=1 Tax=Desulfotruncus arcticus TaxID=341036 RepID=UPI0013F4EB03|nr:hypothetical protein [Desulfotruncus arcticus]
MPYEDEYSQLTPQGNLKIIKEPPSINTYQEYMYFKDEHMQQWNEVIEAAGVVRN